MTPEYEREKQPSRGLLQKGVIMQLFCNCNEIPWKISVKDLTFTKVASLQPATLRNVLFYRVALGSNFRIGKHGKQYFQGVNRCQIDKNN